MPELNVVEPVDLGDLDAAKATAEASGIDRLRATLHVAGEVMTEIDISGIGKRLNSLQKGTARNPADAVETACLRCSEDDGLASVNIVLRAPAASSRRIFRKHLLLTMFDALAGRSSGRV